MDRTRTWLITGVSGGLGRALAEAALAHGDTVIGTLRRADQFADFEALAPGRSIAAQLDVTEPADQVGIAIRSAAAHTGRLDVVVNNAGYGLVGAVEEVSEDEARSAMETNFFGPLKVIKAALPFLRAQGGGHIVNISSAAGILGSPGLGLYNAAKFALEGLSEALAGELRPLGIHVTIVGPGAFRTDWAGGGLRHATALVEDYREITAQTRKRLDAMDGAQPGDPAKAAEAILAVLDTDRPPTRLALGSDAIQAVERKMATVRADLETWRETSLSTAFAP